MGMSLFYAGFHGVVLSVYGDDIGEVPPVECLVSAIHTSYWCYFDVAQGVVLLMMCADRVVSVVWTKTHKVVRQRKILEG